MQLQDVRIGASESAAALGLSPYQSALQWWAQKLGKTPRFEGNEAATVLGQYFEAAVAKLFADGAGVELSPGGSWADPSTPWFAATPDFIVEQRNMSAAFKGLHSVEPGEVVLLEIKTAGLASYKPPSVLDLEWGADGSRDIPVGYATQVQQQIAVVDAELRAYGLGWCRRAVVKALLPGRGAPEFVIDRDPEVEAWLRSSLARVVTEHLVPEVPPTAATVKDWTLSADLRERAFKGKSSVRPASSEEHALMLRFRQQKAELKEQELRLAETRALLISAIGDDYAIKGSGSRASYSAGKLSPALRKAAAYDELATWARTVGGAVAERFEAAAKKHTTSRRTGRLLTVRVDDRPDDDDETNNAEGEGT